VVQECAQESAGIGQRVELYVRVGTLSSPSFDEHEESLQGDVNLVAFFWTEPSSLFHSILVNGFTGNLDTFENLVGVRLKHGLIV
jgi:hypothetical protein